MRFLSTIFCLTFFCFLIGCTDDDIKEKGFPVSTSTDNIEDTEDNGIINDSLVLLTRPASVLLTGNPQYRLTTIYKVNFKDENKTFIGSNEYYYNYCELGTSNGNQWNYHLIPGIEAVYGYNMVNISHYDIQAKVQKNFFEKPVLIKSLYYPSFSKDTLNHKPVYRNYFMISVYDEDTNKDGFINVKDLRRFYYYDITASNKRPLVPINYSVFKSEYDPANDYMYVFARLDENRNGLIDEKDPVHVYWIDLNNPENIGRQY